MQAAERMTFARTCWGRGVRRGRRRRRCGFARAYLAFAGRLWAAPGARFLPPGTPALAATASQSM